MRFFETKARKNDVFCKIIATFVSDNMNSLLILSLFFLKQFINKHRI